MSQFIVKPKKLKPEYDFIEQEFDIFKRGRYGRHVKVGSITEYNNRDGAEIVVRFESKIIPINQAVRRSGQIKSWIEYEKKKESVSFYMTDLEAAKLFATYMVSICIHNGD